MSMQRVKVTGVKWFVGEVEGKDYDSSKVFIEMPLDASRGNAKGFGSIEFPLGKAEEAKRIMHNPFPLMCDIEFEQVISGKTTKTIVKSLRPADHPEPVKKAA